MNFIVDSFVLGILPERRTASLPFDNDAQLFFALRAFSR